MGAARFRPMPEKSPSTKLRKDAAASGDTNPRRRGSILFVIVGAGVAAGLSSVTTPDVLLNAVIAGVAINAYLLLQAAHYSASRRYFLALAGAVPAGVFDALKVALIAFPVRWIASLV